MLSVNHVSCYFVRNLPKMPTIGCVIQFLQFDLKVSCERQWEVSYLNWKENWNENWANTYSNLVPDNPLRAFVTAWTKNSTLELKDGCNETSIQYKGADDFDVLIYSIDDEKFIVDNSTGSYIASYAFVEDNRIPSLKGTFFTSFAKNLDCNRCDNEESSIRRNVLYFTDICTHETVLKPLTFKYYIQFTINKGLSLIENANGSISGMAISVDIETGSRYGTATVNFECMKEKSSLSSVINTFGTEDNASHDHNIELDIKLNSKKEIKYFFNITEQMKGQTKGGVIIIPNINILSHYDSTIRSYQSLNILQAQSLILFLVD